MLIRQGAKLVETASDVLEELKPLIAGVYASSEPVPQQEPSAASQSLELDYVRLLEKMGYDPVTVDQLVERSQLTPAEVSSMLLILELRGHINALPGGRYVHKG
jgi:DNA processing protein